MNVGVQPGCRGEAVDDPPDDVAGHLHGRRRRAFGDQREDVHVENRRGQRDHEHADAVHQGASDRLAGIGIAGAAVRVVLRAEAAHVEQRSAGDQHHHGHGAVERPVHRQRDFGSHPHEQDRGEDAQHHGAAAVVEGCGGESGRAHVASRVYARSVRKGDFYIINK